MIKKMEKGFSLIEIVIVIVVLGIVASVMSTLLYHGTRGYLLEYEMSDVQSQARLALERMTREIRMVYSRNQILTMTASQFSFKDFSDNTITYQLTGNDLMRNTQALADHVTALSFVYWQKNGAVATTTANIYYVQPTITITRDNTSIQLSTTVALRNFK